MSYTGELVESTVPGYVGYMISNPQGEEHCAGRYFGTEKETLAHIKKVCEVANKKAGLTRLTKNQIIRENAKFKVKRIWENER